MSNRMAPTRYQLPNFLYIGPDKAGSTWLFKVLDWHNNIYVTPAKDIYFFDKYYKFGLNWYLNHFTDINEQEIIAEISHDYLYSKVAANRIHDTLPNVRLMVTLREPIDRAHSAYLYLLKHGLYSGSFEVAIRKFPELLERGYYSKYLEYYLKLFGAERVFIGLFDSLKEDPNKYAKSLFSFLGVEALELPAHLREKTLPASRARSVLVAKWAKRASLALRGMGMARLVGKIKTSPIVQQLLYVPYQGSGKPTPDPQVVSWLREIYAPEIARLDALLGTDLQSLWRYK